MLRVGTDGKVGSPRDGENQSEGGSNGSTQPLSSRLPLVSLSSSFVCDVMQAMGDERFGIACLLQCDGVSKCGCR
jgi:hypothetical protein